MSTDPNHVATASWETRLREAAAHVEQDLRQVVTFINDQVVPDIRRNGTDALRSAAAELERLARHMDETNRQAPPPPPPPPPPAV